MIPDIFAPRLIVCESILMLAPFFPCKSAMDTSYNDKAPLYLLVKLIILSFLRPFFLTLVNEQAKKSSLIFTEKQ